jgi:hypothetical protein
MWTAVLTIAGSLIAGIGIPLFGIWLKGYLDQKAADAQAAALAAVLEKQSEANQTAAQAEAARINAQIAAEEAAKQAFVNPPNKNAQP